MQIIQNSACLVLTCNAAERTVYFNSEIVRGKKISSMYLFASNAVEYSTPSTAETLATLLDVGALSISMNAKDIEGNVIVKEYNSNNFILGSEPTDTHTEWDIDRVIDWNNTSFNFKALNSDAVFKIVLIVFFQTEPLSAFNDEITGTISLPIATDGENDIKLVDLLGDTLKNKCIKKIVASPEAYGYLHLVTDKGLIENIPTRFLQCLGLKSFCFDNIKIDAEKSFFRNRGLSENVNITFQF